MAAANPYIGSKISLVSNSDIRYEGVLYTINTQESTIALQSVRCCGTEGRKAQEIPPSSEIYDFIIFRGQDIKDLMVLESAIHLSDPAIKSVNQRPSGGGAAKASSGGGGKPGSKAIASSTGYGGGSGGKESWGKNFFGGGGKDWSSGVWGSSSTSWGGGAAKASGKAGSKDWSSGGKGGKDRQQDWNAAAWSGSGTGWGGAASASWSGSGGAGGGGKAGTASSWPAAKGSAGKGKVEPSKSSGKGGKTSLGKDSKGKAAPEKASGKGKGKADATKAATLEKGGGAAGVGGGRRSGGGGRGGGGGESALIGELLPSVNEAEKSKYAEEFDYEAETKKLERKVNEAELDDKLKPREGYDKGKSFFDNISCEATDRAADAERPKMDRTKARQYDTETFGDTRRPPRPTGGRRGGKGPRGWGR